MTRLRVWVSRVLGLVGRRWRDEDLVDDIDAHLDLLAAEHRRRGLSPADAAAAARRESGGVESMKEACRDRRGLLIVEQTWQDVRYALRQMRRNNLRWARARALCWLAGVTAAWPLATRPRRHAAGAVLAHFEGR